MAYVEPKTAKDVVNGGPGGSTEIEDENKAKADTANVRRVEYIDYADAMANYEARDDVETLAHRRAREAGDQFTDADFVRAEGYDGT